ncbi:MULTISPECIES: MFS transporter [Sorangium]|uniref:Permease of the major facilitator superfamily n=1 Tax=Sorangium cellulosum (strain So ce56) TaxID=448385 RepID=A9F7V5_SORC5|nr:permease of the major facilitator superfamily [Sorangium cellulosum So ce56]
MFAALSSVMGLSVGVAKVSTTLYALELGANEALLGLISGSQSVGVLLMSIPIGLLVDHLGPSRLFVLGSLVAGSLYMALPAVPSPVFLLAFTTAISFFMPMRFVSLSTVFMQQLETVGEGKAGWYRGTHMVGMFLLGPMLAASLTKALGFSGTYRLIGLSFLITVLMSPIVFGPYTARPAHPRSLRLSGVRSDLALLAQDVELRSVCLIEFAAQSINSFFMFFIIPIGVTVAHLTAAEASGLLAWQGVTFIFALFALGGLVGRVGHERVYLASLVLVPSALLLLGLSRDLTPLRAGGLLLGLGLGILQIANLTRIARIGARAGRGKVAGLQALVGPSGGLFGSAVGGLLGRSLGLQTMFLLLSVFFGLLLAAARRTSSAAAAASPAPAEPAAAE